MIPQFFQSALKSTITIAPVVWLIAVDTVMGVLRAAREKSFNSSVGIDGAIRKAGMLLSVAAFAVIDAIARINLIGFIPEQVWGIFGFTPPRLGSADFFGLLFIAYEIVSVLKNMYRAGLPVKGVWVKVKAFLQKWTNELPDDD